MLEITSRFHLKSYNIPVAKAISDNKIVDNVCIEANSAEKEVDLYSEAKNIFKGASMNLREWTSNCNKLRNSLPEGERSSGKVIKVFDSVWNQIEDYILQIPIFKGNPNGVDLTIRQVLADFLKYMTHWVCYSSWKPVFTEIMDKL